MMISEDEIEMPLPVKSLSDIVDPHPVKKKGGRPKGTTREVMEKRRFNESVARNQQYLDALDAKADEYADILSNDIVDKKLAAQALRKATADRVMEKRDRFDLAIREDEKADENRQFNAHIVKVLRLGIGDDFDNPVALFDNQQIQDMWAKTLDYIRLCVEDGVRLTKYGFWASIGTTETKAGEWRRGVCGTMEHQRLIGYIDNIFAMSNEMLGTHGRITAPTYIWNDKVKNNTVEKTKEEEVNDLSNRELSADEIASKWSHVVSDFDYDERRF